MTKAVKWAIGGALLVTAVAVASKAKNALDKLSFRIHCCPVKVRNDGLMS